ncbi:MAG: M4 family metallopeptidase [Holophagaceae bacterium]|nr:M4 family metallopeptidase [Holophagaceae bacterium]
MSTRLALRLVAAGLLLVPALGAREREAALAAEGQRHLEARVHQLGLSRDHSFATRNVFEEATGEAHVRLNQLYKGVRVFEGESIVHLRGGAVTEHTDALVRGLALSVSPSLSAPEALATAHGILAPRGAYAYAPTVELVIATPTEGSGKGRSATPTLVYHVHTELENAQDGIRHTDFLVDAHSGAVLEQWNTLHTAGVTATGKSQYSGVVSIPANSTATGFELRDMTRGARGTFGNNVVTNANHAATSSTAAGTVYASASNTWGDGANYVEGSSTTAANGQTAAVDAMYGMAQTWDFYKNVFARNGIDNAGTATYSRVHIGSGYDNAFWSDSCFCMTYGDGTSFLTLTALDVAGHEMSHGVCARTANLAYRAESGGLNEANSDIFGTLVEFMARGGGSGTIPNYTAITSTLSTPGGTVPAANYLIGEQLETSAFAKPLRYMYKPSLDKASADAWSTSLKRLDVHYSSGPANHFFFLLAHGSQIDAFSGGIQSPLANGVTSITGLGNDLAGRIWYKALTAYMTSSTTYAGARTATLSACTALGYPSGSAVYTTVNSAWLAVNVK